jgi:hypothetical protein
MKAALKRCPSRSGPRFWKNIVPLLTNGKNTIVIAGSTSNRYSQLRVLLVVIAGEEALVFMTAKISLARPIAPKATRIAKAKATGVCSRNENRRTTTRMEKPIRICCRGRERFGKSHVSESDFPITRQIERKITPQRAILKKRTSTTLPPEPSV